VPDGGEGGARRAYQLFASSLNLVQNNVCGSGAIVIDPAFQCQACAVPGKEKQGDTFFVVFFSLVAGRHKHVVSRASVQHGAFMAIQHPAVGSFGGSGGNPALVVACLWLIVCKREHAFARRDGRQHVQLLLRCCEVAQQASA
jgi:hypothetical protein